MTKTLTAALLVIATLATVVSAVPVAQLPTVSAASVDPSFRAGRFCLQNTDPRDLDELFDTEPAGLVGADYQRAFPLPDGRTVWLFQDVEVRLPNGWTTLVHNVGMIQQRSCFEILMSGNANNPQSWLFGDRTRGFERWFWGLDAEMGSDGLLYIFAGEMLETGDEYLTTTIPQGVHYATFDPASSDLVSTGRPPDQSPELYGWSITSDNTWTYLYAHCYRQFGFDPLSWSDVGAHDLDCAADVTVARVPKSQLLDPPAYWDGTDWQDDPAAAMPVFDTTDRAINPVQVEWDGQRFHAVTKVGDWFGDTIYIERAQRAQGPFDQWAFVATEPKCADCNTYFASIVPPQATTTSEGGAITVSLSHNRWDGIITDVYTPTFFEVRRPHPDLIPARRCSQSVGC